MNERIAHVFTGIVLLFVAIFGMLTWWQIIAAGDLRQKNENRQSAYYEQRVKRGEIKARNGNVIAANRSTKAKNGDTIYSRVYRAGGLAAHVIGYNTSGKSRTGLEKRYNDELTGATAQLTGFLGAIGGEDTVNGNSLQLTLRAQAQRVAERELAGEKGAIVALDPRTGAVLVMAASPDFDPNKVEGNSFGDIVKDTNSPLLNRATQGRYQPGSTFKLITAAAAIEKGIAEPDTEFPGGCEFKTAGPPVKNFGGSCYGRHDLTTALTQSINTTFAQLGRDVGDQGLRRQMEKFGFDSTPPLDDLPVDELFTSGLYGANGKVLPDDQGIDASRLAIGQERLQVTPLQMAMVVSAIANDGVLMKPYLVDRILRPNGDVKETREAEEVSDDIAEGGRTMSAETARKLTEMMTNVVREGSGTAATLEGIDVAGKTGTADTTTNNQVWFVAFAPADNPRVAIVGTFEDKPSGTTGGGFAAPKVRAVLEALKLGGRR